MRMLIAGSTIGLLLLVGNLSPARRTAVPESPASQPESLDAWIAILESRQSDERRATAARRIGQHGDGAERAIPVLIDQLRKAPPAVRGAVAGALADIGKPTDAVVESLIEALEDIDKVNPELPVWASAAQALASFGPVVVPRLVDELRGDSDQRLRGAATALYYLGPPAEPAVPDLIGIVERDAPETRLEAIQALQGIGPAALPAVPTLVRMLDSDDFHTQYAACRALAAIGPGARDATEPLVVLLRDGVTSVRRNAAIALGAIGPSIGDEAAAALIAALDDPSQFVKAEAAEAVGKLGPAAASAVPKLEQALRRSSIEARARVAWSHWKITGTTELAVGACIEELEDPDEAPEAARVLGEIGPAASSAVGALVRQLGATYAPTRAAAAEALGRIGPEAQAALEPLERHARDPDAEVRAAVARAILRIRE